MGMKNRGVKNMSAARDILEILLKETQLEAEMKTMTVEQITAKFQNQAATAGYLLEFHLSDEDFFVDHQIFMNRHARYFAMPTHSHEFLELNYLLQGKCTQWIGQEKIQMKQGDLLMIDPGTGHSIDKLGEQDILINILIKSDAINTKVLQRMAQRHSLITDFLLTVGKKNSRHRPYLHFSTADNQRISTCLSYLLADYFGDETPKFEKVELWLLVILAELEDIMSSEAGELPFNKKVIDALEIIDSEYASITLEGLGKQLNFNKNYLSNLLKQETGLTFKEWLTKRRLQKAYDLLIGTDKPIEKIVAELGITSPSYFFKIFKNEYGETPNHIRKKMHRNKKL